MGSLSIWHLLILLVVVLFVFGGGGKIPKLMGDMAKGVKAFKEGLKDEGAEAGKGPTPVPPTLDGDVVGRNTAEHRDTSTRL